MSVRVLWLSYISVSVPKILRGLVSFPYISLTAFVDFSPDCFSPYPSKSVSLVFSRAMCFPGIYSNKQDIGLFFLVFEPM